MNIKPRESWIIEAGKEICKGFNKEMSPKNFIYWGERCNNLMSERPGNIHISGEELRCERIFRKVKQEVLPMGTFLKCCNDYQVKSIIYPGGDQKGYDGVLEETSGRKIFLEITNAQEKEDGKHEYLIIKTLDKFRGADPSANNEELENDLRNNKQSPLKASRLQDRVEKARKNIENAIQRKTCKTFCKNTILVVVENDHYHYLENNDRDEFVKNITLPEKVKSKFCGIYLVDNPRSTCIKIC